MYWSSSLEFPPPCYTKGSTLKHLSGRLIKQEMTFCRYPKPMVTSTSSQKQSIWLNTEYTFRSLIQCAALCQSNPDCGLLKHDPDTKTCELNSGEAGCFYRKAENLQGPALVLHRDLDVLQKTSAVQGTNMTSLTVPKQHEVVEKSMMLILSYSNKDQHNR